MSNQLSCIHYLSEVRLELGGVVQAVVDLCQDLSARGHQVTLVTSDATDVPAHWSEASGDWPRVIEIESSSLIKQRISRRGLNVFRELLDGVDLAHLHTPWDLSNFQLVPILRKQRVPYIVTVHGMLDDWSMRQKAMKKKLFLSLGGRSLFEHATTVHLTAKAELEQASRWVPIGDRGAIQSCVLDLTSYDLLPGPEPALKAFPTIRPEKKKILFLSRLHPKKGVEFLLQAGAILRDQGLPIQLLIAGPGDDSYVGQLKSLSSKLGLDDHTEFLGMVRGVEKRSLYQLSDVFVLPTHQENFGLVLAEALVCGTPVVTTRGTDIWQELQEAGARIADLTPEAIATAIAETLAEEDGGIQLGARGQEYVQRWLERDHVLQGYENIYRETIEKGPRK